MKHTRLLSAAISLLLIVTPILGLNGMTALASNKNTMAGEGTEISPYIVTTVSQLNEVRNDLSAHYRLANDITFSETDIEVGGPYQSWTPIGSSLAPFAGAFDGDGYSVINLSQNISGNYGGLFGCVRGGEIKDLGMESFDIVITSTSDNAYAGGIAGMMCSNSSIINCGSMGSVYAVSSSGSYALTLCGGIVGQAIESSVSGCTNSASVRSSGSNESRIGGIVGYTISSPIENCSNKGQISEATLSSADVVGGIVGRSEGETIIGCFNEGKLLSTGRLGGIVGHAAGCAISRCFNEGAVGAFEDNGDCGGIAGTLLELGSLSLCYNIGEVSGENCGGIALELGTGTSIANCYNTAVIHAATLAGGIVWTAPTASRVSCSYNAGELQAPSAGGIAGTVGNYVLSDCIYLDSTADKGVAEGEDITIRRTSSEMQTTDRFSGYDFTNCWTMEGKAAYLYPELRETPMRDILVESISFTNEERSVKNGETLQLEVKIEPQTADNKAVEWSIDYFNSIGSATIDANGLMTAENVGEVVVRATALDGSETMGEALFLITPWEGQGTEDKPYLIYTKKELAAMNHRLFLSSRFLLKNNLDFTGDNPFEYPIGGGYWPPFAGVFDGNGHVITGLNVNMNGSGTLYAGLFGNVQGGTIKNLGMEGGSIACTSTGTAYAGGIAGRLAQNAVITNCYSTNTVTSSTNAGGLAGEVSFDSSIDNSYNAGSVSSAQRAGGITGYCLTGAISEAYNAGTISGNGLKGALIGENLGGTIKNCYFLDTTYLAVGEGPGTATELTEEHMQQQAFFPKLDFANIWTMGGSTTYRYPELKRFYRLRVSGITVQSPAETVVKTDTLQMSAEVLPLDAYDKSVTWSVINGTGMAEIDADGLLTALSVGTVTVRATAKDGSNKYGEKTVTITPLKVSEIIVSSPSDSVTRIYTLQMSAEVLSELADNKAIVWSVENITGEASIDQTGLLRGQSAGTVIVKATAQDGSQISGQKEITVLPIVVSEVTIECDSEEVMATRTLQFSASVAPSYADDISITWSVTNVTGEATITEDGLLLADKMGTVRVRATANGSGAYDEIDITITAAPLFGDANCDGEVDSSDASAILRYVVRLSELSPRGMIQGNVTAPYEDGPDAADAAEILRLIVRLISILPVSELVD